MRTRSVWSKVPSSNTYCSMNLLGQCPCPESQGTGCLVPPEGGWEGTSHPLTLSLPLCVAGSLIICRCDLQCSQCTSSLQWFACGGDILGTNRGDEQPLLNFRQYPNFWGTFCATNQERNTVQDAYTIEHTRGPDELGVVYQKCRLQQRGLRWPAAPLIQPTIQRPAQI
jgi:hypothetical protein